MLNNDVIKIFLQSIQSLPKELRDNYKRSLMNIIIKSKKGIFDHD
jgi:hypothetical protein